MPVCDLFPGEVTLEVFWADESGPRLFCSIFDLFQRKFASCSVCIEGWPMDELPSSSFEF